MAHMGNASWEYASSAAPASQVRSGAGRLLARDYLEGQRQLLVLELSLQVSMTKLLQLLFPKFGKVPKHGKNYEWTRTMT